jgi:hypothetical protein
VLCAVIVSQLLVPAIAYTHLPTQYGFQMFSGLGWTRVTVQDAGGTTLPVQSSRYTANFRDDINWVEHLPEVLCERLPDAATITVARFRHQREHRCD